MMVVTITGIRPDFIRMSKVFEKLDKHFDHCMIHTGQHYDDELSQVFFRELKIRKPDYVLDTGKQSANHYEQLSYLSKEVIGLLKKKKLHPKIVLFLGDSNSAMVSAPLFKEGYRIGHIEGGMRSYDRRMPEEVNRVICDYVSDLIFVYAPLYKEHLLAENKRPKGIHVVGNTIVEVVTEHIPIGPKEGGYIVADIHRSENLKDHKQYNHILEYLNTLGKTLGMEVKLVRFRRAVRMIEQFRLLRDKPNVKLVGPYGFVDFLRLQYHAYGVVSDSGTGQEEGPLLRVPVAVPRNFTERPESVANGNSILVGEKTPVSRMVRQTVEFFSMYSWSPESIRWLGNGSASDKIIRILRKELQP
jgi:UDP-N-acetylglucosamine 2-epimerase (non-hydrolysing)